MYDSVCSAHRSIIEYLENSVIAGESAEKEISAIDDAEMGLANENGDKDE